MSVARSARAKAPMHQLLVVDDVPDICDVVKIGFEARGTYRVFCASNKVEACAALRRGPDLALLDVLMRDNASGEIAALAGELHVPVLRMTGHPEVMRKSLDQGVPILMKPFRVGELVEKVEQLLVEALRLQQTLTGNVRAARQLTDESLASAVVGDDGRWDHFVDHWQHVCR